VLKGKPGRRFILTPALSASAPAVRCPTDAGLSRRPQIELRNSARQGQRGRGFAHRDADMSEDTRTRNERATVLFIGTTSLLAARTSLTVWPISVSWPRATQRSFSTPHECDSFCGRQAALRTGSSDDIPSIEL
jgi:hypothetical protein